MDLEFHRHDTGHPLTRQQVSDAAVLAHGILDGHPVTLAFGDDDAFARWARKTSLAGVFERSLASLAQGAERYRIDPDAEMRQASERQTVCERRLQRALDRRQQKFSVQVLREVVTAGEMGDPITLWDQDHERGN